MSDATPHQVALAKLRELLAQKVIDQSTFELLSASHRADNQGDGAQAVGQKGVGVGGNNLAPIDNSTHFHIGAGDAAAKSQALRKSYLGRMWRQANAVSLLASGDMSAELFHEPPRTTFPDCLAGCRHPVHAA